MIEMIEEMVPNARHDVVNCDFLCSFFHHEKMNSQYGNLMLSVPFIAKFTTTKNRSLIGLYNSNPNFIIEMATALSYLPKDDINRYVNDLSHDMFGELTPL